MTINTDVDPVGTGQQGAGSPFGDDIKAHINEKPLDKLDEAADHAARKGFERQQQEDPSIFTK
jgi:hypothetical protein